MKNFFDFFSGRKRLIVFTERLSELISCGISLQKSLGILGKISSSDAKLSRMCLTLHDSLCQGTKLSATMRLLSEVKIPDWYIAYICVAEECASLSEILSHLKKILLHEKTSFEKFLSAASYPAFVVLLTALAGFFSLYYFLPSFSLLLGDEADLIRSKAFSTMIFADFMLAAVFLLLLSVLRSLLAANPCLGVFQTMAFLAENSVPTLSAVSVAFSFAGKDKKITRALADVKSSLLDGERLSETFAKSFERSGFKKEGLLLSENLSFCEESGKKNAFAKTVAFMEAKKEHDEKILLASIQPLMLLVASFYVALILKTAFLPYLTSFGGLI